MAFNDDVNKGLNSHEDMQVLRNLTRRVSDDSTE